MQGRNWTKSDGIKLEDDATEFAAKIGYTKTQKVNQWFAVENF